MKIHHHVTCTLHATLANGLRYPLGASTKARVRVSVRDVCRVCACVWSGADGVRVDVYTNIKIWACVFRLRSIYFRLCVAGMHILQWVIRVSIYQVLFIQHAHHCIFPYHFNCIVFRLHVNEWQLHHACSSCNIHAYLVIYSWRNKLHHVKGYYWRLISWHHFALLSPLDQIVK